MSRSPLGRALAAVEASLLSDTHRTLRIYGLWFLLLGLIAYCGLGSDTHYPPGLEDHLLHPAQADGAPVDLFFSQVIDYPAGGQLCRTGFGWTPLESATPLSTRGKISLGTHFKSSSGALQVSRTIAHPLRDVKTWLSLLAAIGLLLALAWVYGGSIWQDRRGSRRPETP